MANLNAAMRQVQRTREKLNGPQSKKFKQYSPEYEKILEETANLAGDPAFDDLKQWIIETTSKQRQLPSPQAVRYQAREVCESHEVTVPGESLLFG